MEEMANGRSTVIGADGLAKAADLAIFGFRDENGADLAKRHCDSDGHFFRWDGEQFACAKCSALARDVSVVPTPESVPTGEVASVRECEEEDGPHFVRTVADIWASIADLRRSGADLPIGDQKRSVWLEAATELEAILSSAGPDVSGAIEARTRDIRHEAMTLPIATRRRLLLLEIAAEMEAIGRGWGA